MLRTNGHLCFNRKLFFSVSLNFWSLRRRPDLDYILIMPPLMLLGVLEYYG